MSDLRSRFAGIMQAAGVESLWQAAWAVSADRLAAEYPEGGFCDEAIGHGAWDLLDETGRQDALNELFFAYAEMAGDVDVRGELRALLDGFRVQLLAGADPTVTLERIASLASVLVGGETS